MAKLTLEYDIIQNGVLKFDLSPISLYLVVIQKIAQTECYERFGVGQVQSQYGRLERIV
ncbi:hypothetical protein BDV23DRAFT_26604 [Aspergillus alliaceus]|uniref:Uncharacterized protein n=1 Tax=Petromyces alliaceus TaxID=209559 RepID=A0A5N7BT81_PETAA|nr:hypothetical protein BDV23DRAFT_26604 [Aspergillus alliaceus]